MTGASLVAALCLAGLTGAGVGVFATAVRYGGTLRIEEALEHLDREEARAPLLVDLTNFLHFNFGANTRDIARYLSVDVETAEQLLFRHWTSGEIRPIPRLQSDPAWKQRWHRVGDSPLRKAPKVGSTRVQGLLPDFEAHLVGYAATDPLDDAAAFVAVYDLRGILREAMRSPDWTSPAEWVRTHLNNYGTARPIYLWPGDFR